jgi:Kef-type K+ transport system membrane component KefB/nucleotide-binding universal stress UspA family protein
VSIVAPFFLGSVLALYLYPQLSDSSVSFDGFALFMGAAMSVTAFPVLARILQERNLTRTKVGALTIACAAVDDVTAWAILAIVVAIVRAHALHTPLWVTLIGSATYVALMLLAARPALRLFEERFRNSGRVTHDLLAVILVLMLASAWVTEWLGVHALFGAFCFGAVMPKERVFMHELNEKLEHVTVVFLLPIFFANAGLRTSIGLVSGLEMWTYFGLVMLVAVGGKFGGSTLAARMTGLPWREASALGILMNTRGLMELVILTIGLDLGVISPALFAMMVMMALLTTFMTTPMLQWIYPLERLRESEATDSEGDEKVRDFTVLVPVSLPTSGPGLLRVASALVPHGRQSRIYGAHLQFVEDRALTELGDNVTSAAEDHALQPMLRAAKERELEVRPLVFPTQNPGRDIADLAHVKRADLVLLGWHKPVVSKRILGGAVNDVMTRSRADVAVYVERSFEPWKRILVPYRDLVNDALALEAAGRIARSCGLPITVLQVVENEGDVGTTVTELVNAVTPALPSETERTHVEVKVVRNDDPVAAVVDEVTQGGYDLVVIGVAATWGIQPGFFGIRHERLASETRASLLIIRRRNEQSATVPVQSRELRDAPAES